LTQWCFRNPLPYVLNQLTALGAISPDLFDPQRLLLHFVAQLHAAVLEVVIDACVKLEHARFFGGLSTIGLNTRVISTRPDMGA